MKNLNPFQKVRSQLDKKRMISDLIAASGELLCKAGEDCLFRVQNLRYVDDTNVTGRIKIEEGVAFSEADVVGNFSLGEEKMFFQVPMSLSGGDLKFSLDIDIYKLQRRAHHRLQVEGKREIHWLITEFMSKHTFMTGRVIDISAGGCRLEILKDTSADWKNKIQKIEVGHTLKGELRFSENKVIEVSGVIRHCAQQARPQEGILGVFGLEFIELTPSIRNRITLMTLDLQKKLLHDS